MLHYTNTTAFRVVVYISGHGFGHLAQLTPVLHCLHQHRPECDFLIRCSLPEVELRRRLRFDFELEATLVDVGVVQKSAIEEDVAASIENMSAWVADFDAHVEREISILKAFRPNLVISNISPLAFPAAKAIAVPCIGFATLDWHTIYGHWLAAETAVMQVLQKAYATCELLLMPSMAMDMQVFPNRVLLPVVADQVLDVDFKRKPGWKKCALVIFGGSKQPAFDVAALSAMHDWLFLVPNAPDMVPDNVQRITFDQQLKPMDLMPYADVVVCKPGYGVLAECWKTETPIAWVERPDFPEFPVLRDWLDNYFPSCGMCRSSFEKGDWLVALQEAASSQRQFPAVLGDGAAIAVAQILSFYEG